MLFIKSSFIVPHCSIFFCLHRPLLLHYGLFDQLRVDHGTEFCLCIFVQELLKNRRGDTSRAPWRQTTSTKNYRAERLWPEENARVNYPLKRALNFIKEQEIFNMEDPLVSFAVSWVTLHVSKVGSENFVNSWNYHRIPGEFWCFGRRLLNFYVGVIFSLNFINHNYVFIVTYMFFMWYFPFTNGFVMLFCKEC